MIEYDFEGYAKSKIDKGLGYLEGFSKGYHQAKSEWVGLTTAELNVISDRMRTWNSFQITDVYFAIEAKLKEKNETQTRRID